MKRALAHKQQILTASPNKMVMIKEITIMGKNKQYIINIPRLMESILQTNQAYKITIERLEND